ncbi:MAG: RidA family protein [Lysobacterales bacterium]|nr:MAG: RidA family protein [Xanthomonadales bacterium]
MKRVVNSDRCPQSPKPQSQAVVTDHFIFLSGVLPSDYKSGIAPEAAVNPKLAYCGPPAMIRQTNYMLRCMENVLESAGAGFENLIRIEQWQLGKEPSPWYPVARRALMDPQHPTSTRIVAAGLEVPDALITCDAIAVNPKSPWKKQTHDLEIVPKSITGYPAAQSYGPFVFVPGMVPTDFKTGLAPEAKADPNFWIHSPIKMQTEYILETKKKLYAELGLSLSDVVQASIYLTDMRDLPGMEWVWRQYFPDNPPARVVFPCDGLSVLGAKIEISSIAVRADEQMPRKNIIADSLPMPLFHEPHAVKVGPYLFISGQMAADQTGVVSAARPNPALPWYGSPVKREVEHVLNSLDAICRAAGGSLSDVVRSQTAFLDLGDLQPAFEEWSRAFPSDPPTNMSAAVSGPMPIPGCRTLWSTVALIP